MSQWRLCNPAGIFHDFEYLYLDVGPVPAQIRNDVAVDVILRLPEILEQINATKKVTDLFLLSVTGRRRQGGV